MTFGKRTDKHRHRMRKRGCRPVKVWVPDVRWLRFVSESHRQSLLVARADRHDDDQEFIDAVSVPWERECRGTRPIDGSGPRSVAQILTERTPIRSPSGPTSRVRSK